MNAFSFTTIILLLFIIVGTYLIVTNQIEGKPQDIHMSSCCICLEEDNTYSMMFCCICKDGITCISCHDASSPNPFKLYRCNVCRSELYHNLLLNIIKYAFMDYIGMKQRSALYTRVITHYQLLCEEEPKYGK